MFQRFAKRRCLLIEINPHQVLVAGITRQSRGPVVIDFAAEFDRESTTALRLWIDGKKDPRKRWITAVAGFVARRGLLQRESLSGASLENPAELVAAIQDRQILRVSPSSAPFREATAEDWTFRAVGAADGTPLPAAGSARPALLLGVPNAELHESQQLLLDCHLMPQQLEPALLALFGSLYQMAERRRDARATVVFVLGHDNTAIYILGKEGVHTPGHATPGLAHLVQQVKKEFGLENDGEALQRLMNPDTELRKRIPRLLRPLGAELRPMINSFEMTTGQPAGNIHCAYLPPALAWLAEPLGRVLDHQLLAVDCQEWLPAVGLQASPGLPAFGPHWLGALSLAANLPETVGSDTEISLAEIESFQRPWHVDCRRSAAPPGPRWVGRPFLAGTVAVALLAAVLTVTAWQWYASRSLEADTAYWREQLASNQRLAAELNATLTTLDARAARFNRAYGLMREPYQATEFLMNLGRTLAPRMRIDRIEANDSRVLLAGSLQEPAEDASRSLGRYLETLRRTPRIGELFSAISATSLQRERDADALNFEISLRLKPPPR